VTITLGSNGAQRDHRLRELPVIILLTASGLDNGS
jgi:hypothetical protein